MAEGRVREALTDERLARVLRAYCPAFPGLYLYCPGHANIAPKLRALIDVLKKRKIRA